MALPTPLQLRPGFSTISSSLAPCAHLRSLGGFPRRHPTLLAAGPDWTDVGRAGQVHTPPSTCSTSDAPRPSRPSVGSSLRSRGGFPAPRQQSAVSRRQPSSSQLAASSNATACCEPQLAGTGQDVIALLGVCRTVFCCAALCAIWASLSTCTAAGGGAFASISMALGAGAQTSLSGAHLSARSAWTGLAAGALHTLAGPDHLAALTPLTIGRSRMVASAMGALWGFGHCTGQACLGLAFVLLKERFHDFAPALTRWSGTIVGLTLLVIGVTGIYESHFSEEAKETAAAHAATQDGLVLAVAGGPVGAVPPVDGSLQPAPQQAQSGSKTGMATYVTGILHGLQPDALYVVVPALALPTRLAVIMYCVGFVLGTVGAMGGYTLVIGTTSEALLKKRPWLQAHLSTVASVIAIAVGLAVLAGGFGFEVPFMQH